MHCGVFGSIAGLYPAPRSSALPQVRQPKTSLDMVNPPWGAKLPQNKTTGLEEGARSSGRGWMCRAARSQLGAEGSALICPGAEELQVPVWRACSLPGRRRGRKVSLERTGDLGEFGPTVVCSQGMEW